MATKCDSLDAFRQVKVPAGNSYFAGVALASSFFFWAQFKVLVNNTYKTLYGLGPGYLNDRLILLNSAQPL